MNFKKTIFAGALVLLITVSGAIAQIKRKPAPSNKSKPVAQAQQIKPAALPVDPNVIIGKLANGLTYYIRSNSFPKNKAGLFLINKAGSILETDAQQGMAHLTQRLAFDGTRDFTKDQLESFLKRPGVKYNPDAYANTSYDETVFQLNLPTDTAKIFETGFKVLANWAGYVKFDAADVEKEKNIALEEVRGNAKNQQGRIEQQTMPALVGNSKYAQRLPAGKEDIIKTFNNAAVKSFYHDWYRPDLQAVIIVGDFDAKHVEQLVKENFSSLKNPAPEKPFSKFSSPVVPGTVVKLVTDKDLNYTAVQIVSKHPQLVVKSPADFLQNLRINLFNQMLNARITDQEQLRNPPFVYGQASYGGFTGRQDAFSAIVRARPGGVEDAVKAIAAETERAKKFGFTSTELERAKQNVLLQIGNAYEARNRNNSTNYAGQYIQNFLTGEAITGIDYQYNFYVNNIGKISVAEINALAAKFISDQNRSIIVVAPETEKTKLPDEKKLLDWMAEAGKNVTPYNDDLKTEPLLAVIPQGSKVIKRQEDSVINITRLTLANGLKVILKPTQFSNNQVLISGYSFGGTSLASDNDYPSANMAATAIAASGVANLNQDQLNIKLKGTQINITPYISEIAQGISGNSTPADFETTMQLLYLYFTQPRKDVNTWQTLINQSKALIANRVADPASVYQDTVTAVLNNHNMRAMPTTIEQLNTASLDKAYDFYKARFADASGFTFTFVGNFTNDQIIPFIETYLGALPSDNHKETYKNLGIHPTAGQITRTVTKGAGDKSTVQMIFSGSYDYNESNNIQLDALEEILNLDLLTRFPEKESGAVSLSAGVSYVKIPESRYKVTISFLCDPTNVDKLTNGIIDEINKLKQTGSDPKFVDKFVNDEARSIQAQLKQNYFWTGYLGASSQNQEDPDNIIPHIQNLNQVTVQSVKDASAKYLNNNNLIKLILMPEKK
ncbi:MAG: peptidase [Mucilaginibacter sp.]|nr:peptidase [Mucilaginibacter sp.]